ncbi:MAG TPA: hypothetical protein VGM89_18650 [Puia sp.]|jgi:plasmid maintenance system antidote protein VapI
MVSAGRIHHFRDLFHFIPKTIVARDLGINNVRFTRLIDEVEGFTLKDLLRLAALMEMDPASLLRLILDQHAADQKAKRQGALK